MLPSAVAADGLGCRSKRRIRDGSVAPHHSLRLPPTKRHYDWRREARVERHRRAMVPEIVKMEVLQAGAAGGFPEDPGDVHAAVGRAVWAREYPHLVVGLQLPL